MIPDYRICDKCKKGHLPNNLSFFVATDTRQADGAGSRECVGFVCDLCHTCAIEIIKGLCKDRDINMNYEVGKFIEKRIRK